MKLKKGDYVILLEKAHHDFINVVPKSEIGKRGIITEVRVSCDRDYRVDTAYTIKQRGKGRGWTFDDCHVIKSYKKGKL